MGKFKELIRLYSWEEKVSEKIVGKVYIYSLNRGEMLEREADLVEVVKKIDENAPLVTEYYSRRKNNPQMQDKISGMKEGELSKSGRWLWLSEKDGKKAAEILLGNIAENTQKRLDEIRRMAEFYNEIAEKYDIDIRIE